MLCQLPACTHTTTEPSCCVGFRVVLVRRGCAACVRVCVCMCACTPQLAEVYWVEGLGPSQVELWTLPDSGTPTGTEGVEEDDTHHRPAAAAAAAAAAGAAGTHARNSFADQVGPGEGREQQALLAVGSRLDLRPAAAVMSVVSCGCWRPAFGCFNGPDRGAHGGCWLPLCTTAPRFLLQASGGHALVWSCCASVLPPASQLRPRRHTAQAMLYLQ